MTNEFVPTGCSFKGETEFILQYVSYTIVQLKLRCFCLVVMGDKLKLSFPCTRYKL